MSAASPSPAPRADKPDAVAGSFPAPAAAGLVARPIEPGDASAMRTLFAEVFGHPMSPALWAWKYENQRGAAIGVWRGDKLVAHYGGVSRVVLDAGKPVLAAQVVDVAVLPAERGILTRRGAFFLAATRFLQDCIGFGTHHLYGFGFPNNRAYRLANKLGLYAASDHIAEFSFPAVAGALEGLGRGRVVLAEAALLPQLGVLRRGAQRAWSAMRRELAPLLLGVRDLDYLLYRYANHPQHAYQVIALRAWPLGPVNALAVVRSIPGQGLEWLDFIGATRQLPRLAHAVQGHAARCGLTRVFGWITASQQAYFAAAGATLASTDIIVPANVWSQGPAPATQSNRWWLTSGDTDFK